MNRICLSLLLVLALACVAYSEDKTCSSSGISDWKCNKREECCGYKAADGTPKTTCCKEYESCCQGACCDKLTTSCIATRNPADAQKDRKYCSSVEHVNPITGMKVVVPPITGVISILVTFIIIAHSGQWKQNGGGRAITHTVLTFVEFGALVCFLFSAAWHYSFLGLVLLGASMYLVGHAHLLGYNRSILTATSLQALFALLVVGMFPFIGTFDTHNANRGIFFSFNSPNDITNKDHFTSPICTQYYQFWARDTNLLNPYKEFQHWSWGYCQPGWMASLIIISLVMVGVIFVNVMITFSLIHKPHTHTDNEQHKLKEDHKETELEQVKDTNAKPTNEAAKSPSS